MDRFSSHFNGFGYQRLPSGFIIQWGVVQYKETAGQNGQIQTFFAEFSKSCFAIVTSDVFDGVHMTSASPISRSQFKCWGRDHTGSYRDTGLFYIAIGV